MSFKLRAGRHIDTEVRRIAAEQVDSAIAEIEDAAIDRPKAVHSVRKRCRRIRALLRLVREGFHAPDVYRAENAFYRDLARSLADARDADVTRQTLDRVLDEFGPAINRAACEPIRRRLAADAADGAPRARQVARGLDEAANRLRVARQRIGSWELSRDQAALRRGLHKTYRDGRRAMATARGSGADDAVHEWRKQAKNHREHIRLFEDACPAIFKPWYAALDDLCDTLGTERDLALLDAAVIGLANGVDRAVTDTLRGLISVRREALRERAWALGERLYGEQPKFLARRISAGWEAAGR